MAIKVCPSCGSSNIDVAGDKVHCSGCEITFTITAQGAKVDDLNPLPGERLTKIEKDIEELKKRGQNEGPQKTDEETTGKEETGFGISIENDEPEAGSAGGE